MELSNCPNCQSTIPSEEPVSACAVCGTDLTSYAASATPPPMTRMYARPAAVETNEFNLTHGILGAVAGAAVGVGAMFGFYEMAGFRFPLLGVGIGLLTGYGAKLFYKGTDQTLGIISGAIALFSVLGTLLMIYGTDNFPMLSIISVVVSASVAYRISS